MVSQKYQVVLVVEKKPACQCRRPKKHVFDPWVRKNPWRRERLPTPVFLPKEPHGQRSLVGYSPWGRVQSDTTERLTLSVRSTSDKLGFGIGI